MAFKADYATLIPVKNITRAIRFYTQKLGGRLLYRGEGDMKDFWASMKVGKEEFWLVSPEQQEKRELAYSVFVVKDIRKAVTELQGKGVRFLPGEKMGKESRVEGPMTFERSGASAFFKDSEGNLLMVWQNTPEM